MMGVKIQELFNEFVFNQNHPIPTYMCVRSKLNTAKVIAGISIAERWIAAIGKWRQSMRLPGVMQLATFPAAIEQEKRS